MGLGSERRPPSSAALALALMSFVALGACAGTADPDGGTDGAYGTSGAYGGDPGNPSSPAYFQQTLGDRVFFAVDQSTLSPEAQAVLAEQANWLLENAQYTATIEGHADERGTREYNLALGARRANSVREFLVDRGVAGNRLEVVSFGKERPIEICSAESCYARNRRGVTVLSTGVSG